MFSSPPRTPFAISAGLCAPPLAAAVPHAPSSPSTAMLPPPFQAVLAHCLAPDARLTFRAIAEAEQEASEAVYIAGVARDRDHMSMSSPPPSRTASFGAASSSGSGTASLAASAMLVALPQSRQCISPSPTTIHVTVKPVLGAAHTLACASDERVAVFKRRLHAQNRACVRQIACAVHPPPTLTNSYLLLQICAPTVAASLHALRRRRRALGARGACIPPTLLSMCFL